MSRGEGHEGGQRGRANNAIPAHAVMLSSASPRVRTKLLRAMSMGQRWGGGPGRQRKPAISLSPFKRAMRSQANAVQTVYIYFTGVSMFLPRDEEGNVHPCHDRVGHAPTSMLPRWREWYRRSHAVPNVRHRSQPMTCPSRFQTTPGLSESLSGAGRIEDTGRQSRW